jgi:hypothetical protein
MSSVSRCLLAAQVTFWTSVVVCFAIANGGLSHNHGLSVYGGRPSTFVPWAIGFVVSAAFIARAAALLDAHGEDVDRQLANALRLLVALLVALLATPDTIDQVFYVAHIVASVALFSFQAGFGLWLVLRRAPTRIAAWLYGAQIFGGCVAGLSEAQWLGLLSPGIVLFQLAFGALLVVATAEAQPALETARSAP